MKIKDLPQTERPYEKLEIYGAENLSNAELLAIIIKTGTKEKSSISIAQEVLKLKEGTMYDNLRFLQDISLEEFMQIKGIGKVKAIQLKAICELTKRIARPIDKPKTTIKNPKDVFFDKSIQTDIEMHFKEKGYKTFNEYINALVTDDMRKEK